MLFYMRPSHHNDNALFLESDRNEHFYLTVIYVEQTATFSIVWSWNQMTISCNNFNREICLMLQEFHMQFKMVISSPSVPSMSVVSQTCGLLVATKKRKMFFIVVLTEAITRQFVPIPCTSCDQLLHNDCKSTMNNEMNFLSLIVPIVLVMVFFRFFELYECCSFGCGVARFVWHSLYYATLGRSDHILSG